MFLISVAITMAFGLYSPETMWLGPNASILIQHNHLFVESIEKLVQPKARCCFDASLTWQETHTTSLPSNTHKEWVHHLNQGSQISISYSVSSWSLSFIGLVIAEGKNELAEWLKDPTYPDSTFSWNIIHGEGMALNPEIFTMCRPADEKCTFPLLFMGANASVLTSPSQVPGSNCYVKISYGPRWITHVIGAGRLILLMLLLNYLLSNSRRTEQGVPSNQPGDTGPERNPLLSRKDDDTSVSEDEDHVDDAQSGDEQNPVKDDEDSRRFCAICFEAPKDSFFVPCGHRVACFGCANRIVETSATCPICRRKTKKAKNIYTV
ncbi:hypothetical protein OROHE_005947 [Orobanche hederae]